MKNDIPFVVIIGNAIDFETKDLVDNSIYNETTNMTWDVIRDAIWDAIDGSFNDFLYDV